MADQSIQTPSANSATKDLTRDDLPNLCEILNSVAPKCFELGLRLGVEETRIKIIITNNRYDCEAQLREIISERLKQDSPLTWHDIVLALRSPSVNHPDLVRVIESQYKSTFLDLQQHFSLGREPMVMIGQTRVGNHNVGMTSVSNSSTSFRTSTGQTPVRGPPHYQPPTLMMGQMQVGYPCMLLLLHALIPSTFCHCHPYILQHLMEMFLHLYTQYYRTV